MNSVLSRFLRIASPVLRSVVLSLLTAVAPGLGEAYGQELPVAPPYLVGGTNHVLVGVVWDEAAIREALPSWLTPAKDVTGLIDIYQTGEVYGLAPYRAAYFSVDLEGFDSPSGVKGRWILQGVYGPQDEAPVALKHWYGLPVRKGTSRFEATAGGKRAFGAVNGEDFVSVEIKSLAQSCGRNLVSLNYVTPEGLLEIAVTGEACEAEPISVEVHAPPGDPFAAFRPVKVLWAAEYKNGAFALTRSIPLYH
jgi:hypothetical protein